VQSGAAGFDNPVFGAIVQKGARLTTSHGQAVGMADYVLWGVLDYLQRGAARGARTRPPASGTAPRSARSPARAGPSSASAPSAAAWRCAPARSGRTSRVCAAAARRRGGRPDGALAELPDLLPDTDVLVLCRR
jgi:hypothetical protein